MFLVLSFGLPTSCLLLITLTIHMFYVTLIGLIRNIRTCKLILRGDFRRLLFVRKLELAVCGVRRRNHVAGAVAGLADLTFEVECQVCDWMSHATKLAAEQTTA